MAPVSWLVQDNMEEGRRHLNFSEWNKVRDPYEIIEVIQEGEMPPSIYLIMHLKARLTRIEKDAFTFGVEATIGGK